MIIVLVLLSAFIGALFWRTFYLIQLLKIQTIEDILYNLNFLNKSQSQV